MTTETAQVSLTFQKKTKIKIVMTFFDIEIISQFCSPFIYFSSKFSVDLFRPLQLKFCCYCFIMNNVLVAITVYNSEDYFFFPENLLIFFLKVSIEITKRYSFFHKPCFFVVFVVSYLISSSNIRAFQADLISYVN